MGVKPTTQQAYQLMHDGILALARAERAGIRLDLDYVRRKQRQLARRIEAEEQNFLNSKIGKGWQKKLGGKEINLKSSVQLGNYLYDELGYKAIKKTPSGKGSTDEEALRKLDVPELNGLLYARKLKKMNDYLDLFYREQVDGYIHPVFNLHFARTYRSSSDSPNFQNIPKRDPEAMKITRGALYPRPGHQLIELDYSGLEVRIAACYHKDKNMLNYINDPSSDMHRDMAMQIFKMDSFDKSFESHYAMRQAAKNGFVFPQFYGDYYKNNALGICNDWIKLPQGTWKANTGIQMFSDDPDFFISDYLRSRGLKSFKAFENHLQDIEYDFWNNRFSDYARWKERWWRKYQKNGFIDMKTGFRCTGVMSRNDCTNYPVQGAAFHCLLWSFIHLDEIMRREQWDSRLIGQIHDSIIIDVLPSELDHVKEVAHKVTCEYLPLEWKWIIVPLEIEIDIHPVDGSWAEKL